ncbi:MetQ/NlpA family ABC transporter substrate-binding protein [Bacillus mesophilum]|uniref:Lipoprotein n=1 Tax=Bacillus mesophilum TaxID=1071718 RepID=A0A7V7RL90_9BACI|nr:MetQ/NlpA family ABC transporter substrate-binding protein [Bacillus mesophilum]KAB2331470.1 MetQ/NlpA family ABC transporter substrate-binding protein [Bacillus mesophilum]
MVKNKLMVLILILTAILAACASESSPGDNVVKVGTTSAEAPTWELVKDLAAEEDIEIEIINFNDYVQPNLTLDSGEIDLNAFQTIVYFDSFVEDRNLDLAAIGTTSIWPMGIYSNRIQDVSELQEGDQVIIPKDPTNLGRALSLLEKAELIQLKEGFDGTGGVENVVENPKNLEIIPVDAGQTPRGLDDAAISIINSDMAINSGLNPTNDPIFREDSSNKAYINIIAAQTENKDDEVLNRIVEIYHTDEVSSFIEEEFGGAALPVKEPISFLDDYEQN